MKSKWFWAVLVALAGLVVYVGNVFATPSTGYASSTLAKAQFGELDSHLHSVPADWQEMIKTPTPDDLKILPQDAPSVSSLPTKIDMIDGRVIFTTGGCFARSVPISGIVICQSESTSRR